MRGPQTSIPDADLKRAANALRRAGNNREAKRLERKLPAPKNKETRNAQD